MLKLCPGEFALKKRSGSPLSGPFSFGAAVKLTKKARAKIPASEFAGPGRSFPIEDKAHARAAIMLSGNAPDPAAVRQKARAVLKRGKGLLG